MAKKIAPYLIEAARGGVKERVKHLRSVLASAEHAAKELAFLETYFAGELNGLGLRTAARPSGSTVQVGADEPAPRKVQRRRRRRAPFGSLTSGILDVVTTSKRPLYPREVTKALPKPLGRNRGSSVATILSQLAKAGKITRILGDKPRQSTYVRLSS